MEPVCHGLHAKRLCCTNGCEVVKKKRTANSHHLTRKTPIETFHLPLRAVPNNDLRSINIAFPLTASKLHSSTKDGFARRTRRHSRRTHSTKARIWLICHIHSVSFRFQVRYTLGTRFRGMDRVCAGSRTSQKTSRVEVQKVCLLSRCTLYFADVFLERCVESTESPTQTVVLLL